MLTYPIFNIRNYKRKKTIDIVIVPIRYLHDKSLPMPYEYKLGSYKYTWEKWQDYFYVRAKADTLPMHYYMEQVDNDYAIYVGCPLITKSWYLEELANCRIIPAQYHNAICIVIGEDFSLDRPDPRLYTHLCDKLLSSLLNMYRLNIDRIHFIDEILVDNYETYLKEYNLNYDFKEQKYFNRDIYDGIMNKYIKR